MIALDNGPANGDYVRYIDQLIAATRTTATGATSDAILSAPSFVPMTNLPTTAGRPAPRVVPRTTPAAADAIARAVLAKASLPKPAVDGSIVQGLAGVLIGIVLIAFGFFSEPIRGFLLLMGFFAFAAGARALTRSVGARVVTS